MALLVCVLRQPVHSLNHPYISRYLSVGIIYSHYDLVGRAPEAYSSRPMCVCLSVYVFRASFSATG